MSARTLSYPERILEQIFVPKACKMSPDAARTVLSFKLQPAHKRRMAILLQATKDDALNAEQAMELESFLSVGRVLDLLHLRARKTLGMPLKLK
jgi:hypothetical protein